MSRKKPIEYALYLLKLRDRSSGEIKEKMKRKGFLSKEIEQTVANLEEKKLVDDEKFVGSYIRNQLQLKPQGKYRLKMKLIRFHLEKNLVDQALDKIGTEDEIKSASQAAKKWLARREELSTEEKKIKLARYLAGRGFGWEIIKTVIVQLLDC